MDKTTMERLALGDPQAILVLALVHRNYSVDIVDQVLQYLLDNNIKGKAISKIYKDNDENIHKFVNSLNLPERT